MTILDLIGNTPLLSLNIDGLKEEVKLFAKAEFMNVGGSVKDRAAKAMLLKGIVQRIRPLLTPPAETRAFPMQ